jgi:hypothetical protein
MATEYAVRRRASVVDAYRCAAWAGRPPGECRHLYLLRHPLRSWGRRLMEGVVTSCKTESTPRSVPGVAVQRLLKGPARRRLEVNRPAQCVGPMVFRARRGTTPRSPATPPDAVRLVRRRRQRPRASMPPPGRRPAQACRAPARAPMRRRADGETRGPMRRTPAVHRRRCLEHRSPGRQSVGSNRTSADG